MKKTLIIIIALVLSLGLFGEAYAVTKRPKDLISPVITKTHPAKYSVDIMIESPISVRFNENIVLGTAFSQISLKDESGTSVSITSTIDKRILKIVPKSSLSDNTWYTLSIPIAAVKDLAGNTLKESFLLDFVTEEQSYSVASIGIPLEISKNYELLLNADIVGGLTEEKKTAIIQRLKTLGITAEILSVEEIAIEEEQNLDNYYTFDILLEDCGENRIQVVNLLYTICGHSLMEARELVYNAPSYIMRDISRDEAEQIKDRFENIGATIRLIGVEEIE